MQPFQPLYNLNFERFFPSPHPISQYVQSPQPFVLGEGDVASVVNPNGAYSFFFVPTMKPWLTISFNPNIPSYIHPYWYTDAGVWIVRSISNPIPWNLFLQMIHKYGNNVGEYSNSINPNMQLPLPEPSQQFMDTQHAQFHNDSGTSTTDLHYFFPRPNTSVNTLLNCECNKINESELNSRFSTVHKVNEMEVTPQLAVQKKNVLQEAPLFSLPQPVVCNRPCFCVRPPISNNQNPMNAFSFRQPYQNGEIENETETRDKDNARNSCSCVPDKPYLPTSGRSVRKSDCLKLNPRKSHSQNCSSDSSDAKPLKSGKKIKGTECVMTVKKKEPGSSSRSSCICNAEERNDKRKYEKSNTSNSKRYKEYDSFSSSSYCDNETCPARRKSESECTDDKCSVANKKQIKSSKCNSKTCPAILKKMKESPPPSPPPQPLRLVSSCNNKNCPARKESEESTSTCSNKTCPVLNKHKKESLSDCDPEFCYVKPEKSSESIASWTVRVKKSDSKESTTSCDDDTCPVRKKNISCLEICRKEKVIPPKKEEVRQTCPEMCREEEVIPFKKEEVITTCSEMRRDEVIPSKTEEVIPICPEIYRKEEVIPSKNEEVRLTGEEICAADSKKCNIKTCRARKKFVPDSDDTQDKEEEFRIQYLDTVHSNSSECDNENCASQKKHNHKSKSIMYVHRKQNNLCSDCSSSNQSAKKTPFSWRSYIVPTKFTSKSKKNHRFTNCCSKCSNHIKPEKVYKSCPVPNDKPLIKQHTKECCMQKVSDDNIRTAGKKYKPRICCNMGPRFLIGKRKREDTDCCTCSSNSIKQDTFFCTCCRFKENSTNARKSTLDKHIATYNDNSTNCAKANATQTKKCKCNPSCHKKDYLVRSFRKDYKTEIWEPKINCDFDCHQFLLDLRGSVPCLYSKNMQ